MLRLTQTNLALGSRQLRSCNEVGLIRLDQLGILTRFMSEVGVVQDGSEEKEWQEVWKGRTASLVQNSCTIKI